MNTGVSEALNNIYERKSSSFQINQLCLICIMSSLQSRNSFLKNSHMWMEGNENEAVVGSIVAICLWLWWYYNIIKNWLDGLWIDFHN